MCSFVLPMQWLPRSEHSVEQCYFCKNTGKHHNWVKRDVAEYVMVDTVIAPEKRTKNNRAPGERSPDSQQQQMPNQEQNQEPVQGFMDLDDDMDFGEGASFEPHTKQTRIESPPSAVDTSSTYQPDANEWVDSGEPLFLTREDYENIVCDLDMSDEKKELLASRLAHRRLVVAGFHVSSARKRAMTKQYDELFATDENTKITYCADIDALFHRMGLKHDPTKWRFFVDGSVDSIKGVLLENGNKCPSIPIAYAVGVKETYESMRKILELVNYEKYKWLICADLKVVGILMGLLGGYCKHQCFLCLWEGRKDELHYDYTHEWMDRQHIKMGEPASHSQERVPLVNADRIILPPLHIKLGMVRNFTKALPRESAAYKRLIEIFDHRLSASKIDNGNFTAKFKIFYYTLADLLLRFSF